MLCFHKFYHIHFTVYLIFIRVWPKEDFVFKATQIAQVIYDIYIYKKPVTKVLLYMYISNIYTCIYIYM